MNPNDRTQTRKSTRAIFLIAFTILLFIALRLSTGEWLPQPEHTPWFQFALLLVVLGSFFIETYYSKPTDVITNSIAVIVTLLSVPDASEFIGWWFVLSLSITLLILAIASMLLGDPSMSQKLLRNRIANLFFHICTFLGRGRLFFSIVFLLALISFLDTRSDSFLILLSFWGIVIIAGPSGFVNLIDRIISGSINVIEDSYATSIGVWHPNILYGKINPDKKALRNKSIVSAKNKTLSDKPIYGIVLDELIMHSDRWVRAFIINNNEMTIEISDNETYPTYEGTISVVEEEKLPTEIRDTILYKNRNKIVGIVRENTEIGFIKFELLDTNAEIEEGYLLKVIIRGKEVLYQITNATTKKESMEDENQKGYIIGTAQQLGTWDAQKCGFERYGWLPEMNMPIFLVDKTEQIKYELKAQDNELGKIPHSNYPVVYSIEKLLQYHTAVLGITGSGKSWLTYCLIQDAISQGMKIICIDFTGDYKDDLKDLKPTDIIPADKMKSINNYLDALEDLKSSDKKYKENIAKVNGYLDGIIENFITDENNHLTIFELPDISNTYSILEFTQLFLQSIFKYAKNNRGKKKIGLVFEEAHTVIPEDATLGVGGDFGRSKGIVGKISQIALQGRKYSVGMLVVAQRTANVTKTVLNQCNSITAFNAFDETGLKFMRNYLGEHMTAAIPNLRELQAVVVGKGFKSKNPLIVKIPTREKTVPQKEMKERTTATVSM